MPVTNYYTVNGEITGEQTTGSSRIDYLTDALGSVTATMNQGAQVVNTYRYKPYGALLSKTGTGPDPSFQWVGSQGYRQTGKKYSDIYVRARHYGTVAGRWTTKDRLTGELAYAYCYNRPDSLTDASGMQATGPGIGGGQVGTVVPGGFGCDRCKPPVPKSDPKYPCYANLCGQYMSQCGKVQALMNTYCPNEPLAPVECGLTNLCLPDVRAGMPSYVPSCDMNVDPWNTIDPRTWRNLGQMGQGRSHQYPLWPWFTLCCQECVVRVCTFIQQPNVNRLDAWLQIAFSFCKQGRAPVPPPQIRLPEGFCFVP